VEHSKGSAKEKFIIMNAHIKIPVKSQINDLMLHLKLKTNRGIEIRKIGI
jgi:hypothetical protein